MKLLNHITVRGEEGNDVCIFSFGGNLGVSLGPVAVTACVKALGLKGTLLLLIPPAVSILLFCGKGRALMRPVPDLSLIHIYMGIFSRQPHHKFQWLKELDDEYVALLPAGHHLCRAEVIPVRALFEEKVLLFKSHKGLDQDIVQILQDIDVKEFEGYTTNSDFTVIDVYKRQLYGCIRWPTPSSTPASTRVSAVRKRGRWSLRTCWV